MAMTPFDPFDEVTGEPITGLMSLRAAMNRLFEDSFISPKYLDPFRRPIPVDLRETETEYVIEASVPGIQPEEIQITATDNLLTLRANRRQEEEKTGMKGQYVRRERYEGELSRTVSLPAPIDASKVTATYEHGVLTISVPKTEEVKPAEIPVKIKGAKVTKEHPEASASV
ncbi:MAG: Hsp20/alpha crystallin family protein [Ktedonobacterales bacterium]